MIEELHIRGLGVIEDATLPLAAGLTVVTGETGAGKTMLVTALELLLGARADTDLVRSGSSAATVDVVVSPPPPEAAEFVEPGDELVASREIPAEGRSRARLDGRPVPAAALAQVLGRHVEVHAQHEHVRLARSDVQRGLLDRYAGDPHARTLERYREAFDTWHELAERADRLERDARERARELDRLRTEVAEIDAAGLDPDVDAQLEARLERLANADAVQQASLEAAAALGSDGAAEAVGVGVDSLRRIPLDDDTVEQLRDRAAALSTELTELAADVRSFGEEVEADPAELAALQERKQLIAQLTRKYGVDVPAVLAYADQARERIAELESADADADTLAQRVAEAEEQARSIAADVRRGRRSAAEQLASVVDGHLGDLGMPHARAAIEVEPLAGDELAAHGGDKVTFLLAANPGEPPRPIATAASGGERSRVSLAIEVALADVDDARVLVFDEVDAGIGGATAMAVGEKLARLAAGDGTHRRQVLCVTHLAQLAAFADVHHVVDKGVVDGRAVTTTRVVGADERSTELARMLGGDASAQAGIDHAQELLDQAVARRAG